MSTETDAWFVNEILPHERALVLFLQRHWSHADEWHDLRQEVYTRIYEAAERGLPHSPKSFLFATARHLMADRLRRARIVSIEPMGDSDYSNVYLIDEVSPEQWMGSRQMLKRLAELLDQLPDRCREVVWLRRVEDRPQKEVARMLEISEKTVEKHLAKGMRLLAEHLYGGASGDPAADRPHASAQGLRNGRQSGD